jgi:two-component system CheB/CheR fusion protein
VNDNKGHKAVQTAAATSNKQQAVGGATPFVVVVGGSAASVDALERFLCHLVPAPDRAVVIVLPHREAINESRLRQTLQEQNLQLTPVESGTAVEGGRVYLGDPDVILTIKQGRFRTKKAQQRPGHRGTLDSLLVSLAEDKGERAIAVILRGMNGEGALGVAAVKEQGGLTIAEDAPDETPAQLATSNSAAALADSLLRPEAIPDRIATYIRHLTRLSDQKRAEAVLAGLAPALTTIAAILRNRTGHDFHGYKRNTFLRRIQRRMQVVQVDEVEDYVEILRGSAEEAQNLFNDLLIGVTHFFRDPEQFELLEKEVIPKLFEGKGSGDQLRVWVLGCASGEEAYSIAILLREHMAGLDQVPHAQIFATDIDGRALAAARGGRYAASIANDLTPERLARWFVKEGNTYCVAKELREMCIFSGHNVIKDAPFSRLDLVSCRNLLIYLNAELQDRVIPLFHFALLPSGFLFLGNSENATRQPTLFEALDRRFRIFRRRDTGARVLPDFPITPALRRQGVETPTLQRPRAFEGTLARRAERVAERHAPAYIITDENFDVLHFSGRTGRFLEPTTGAASLDLLNLVHRDLRLDLRAVLHKAAEQDEPVRVEQLQIGMEGQRAVLDIIVEPVRERPDGPRNFVVIFKDSVIRAAGDANPPTPTALLRDEHIQRLESELRLTRDRLQATIEELESTNEELKSSNEEYQSLNEELQSANEELETSKEELQSVNEELTTVNGELAHRVQELTRATSDLKNFLESTQIATLFLDNDLRVMNFTPALTEIFHLVESDIGRPITHIKSLIPFEDLQDDVRRVLRSLSSVERPIDNPVTGTRYIVRILPYRSVDNFIAGVVVTFVDVTALTRAEERQILLLAELQHRVRNTLAVVRSIARRTAETSDSVEDYAMHLDGRLNAFARTQAMVTRNPAAGVDLEYLVAEELVSYHAHEGEQVTIGGPPVRLQPKAAETFALAVHELATNAVKYGALSGSNGRVSVTWTVHNGAGARHLGFEWAESGVALPAAAPRRRGFGAELLERTLAYELGAKTALDFAVDGLRCRIDLPLTPRIALTEDQRS